MIVIDDGSIDRTPEILARLQKASPFEFKFIRQRNLGPSKTLNKGIRLAQGELVSFLASDDFYSKDKIEKQVECFRRNSRLKIVVANGRQYKDGKTLKRIHSERTIRILNSDKNTILRYLYTESTSFFCQTALYRKDFLFKVGLFDEEVLADDWVLNIRIFQNIKDESEYAYLDEDVVYYRQHESNFMEI